MCFEIHITKYHQLQIQTPSHTKTKKALPSAFEDKAANRNAYQSQTFRYYFYITYIIFTLHLDTYIFTLLKPVNTSRNQP